MNRKLIYIVLLFICTNQLANTQCFEDRHSTNLTDAWVSCQQSLNPNSILGMSNWIMYDLGNLAHLYNLHFWNINHPDFVNYGFKKMRVDYSTDGVQWNNLGVFDIPKAISSGFYEGYRGINFNGIQAQYVTLTGIENYGGNCFGIAEIKIYTSEQSIDNWNFSVSCCESQGLLEGLSFGNDLGGIYSGPGLTDNGNGSFDFDPDLLGPGSYEILYEYSVGASSFSKSGQIIVYSCESSFCGDCPPCDDHLQSELDATSIPEKIYHSDSIQSIGTVTANSNVDFRAEEKVEMNEGFKVNSNGFFKAQIRDCQNNEILNPSFESGFNDWSTSVGGGAIANFSISNTEYFESNQSMELDVTTASSNNYAIRLHQSGINLKANTTYTLKFSLKGDQRKTGTLRIISVEGTLFNEDLTIDPFWNQYVFTFEANQADNNARLEFRFGTTQGICNFDHIRILEVD